MSDISSEPTRMNIAQAQQYVEMTPMSDQRRAEADRQIAAAVQQATAVAQITVDELVAEWQEDFAPLSADLCRVRDDYAALIKAGELGQVTAREFNQRMNAIRRDHRGYARAVDSLREAVEKASVIEDDPVAYAEHIFNVTPMVRPTFTF
jgi:hypothetical protein